MTTLRARLVLAGLVTALIVAAVIIGAVYWFSTDQIAQLLMESDYSEEEARSMTDQYIGRVVIVAALAGVALGA